MPVDDLADFTGDNMGMYDNLNGYTTATGTQLQDIPDFMANTNVGAATIGPAHLNQNYNYGLQNRMANANQFNQISNNLTSAPAGGANALRANQAMQSQMGGMQQKDFNRLGNQLGETMKNEFGNLASINKNQRFNSDQLNKANLQTIKNKIQAMDWERDAALRNWGRANADIAGRNTAAMYAAAEKARKDNQWDNQFMNWFNPRFGEGSDVGDFVDNTVSSVDDFVKNTKNSIKDGWDSLTDALSW